MTLIIFRSALFNTLFFLWTAVWATVCLPLLLLPPKTLVVIVGHTWAIVSVFLLRAVCGISHEIRGRKNIPDKPCIIACKHQSAWETIIFFLVTRYPCFILKKELTRIPLYGLYLKAMNNVVIDRQAGRDAIPGMIQNSREQLDNGMTIVVFPEGTRTAIGQHRQYRSGVGALYAHCGVPVLPAALNSGKYWARNAFIKRPGKIIIEFLPPVEPGQPPEQFLQQLQETIETHSVRLLAED